VRFPLQRSPAPRTHHAGVNRNFAVIINNGDLIYPPVVISFRTDYNFVSLVFFQWKVGIIYTYPSVLLGHKSSNKIG
jgi:hypothetical protein